jgi:hypothetical protein
MRDYNKVPMKDRPGSVRNYRFTLCHKTATAPSIQAWFISGRRDLYPYFFGATQASVTVLSMMCR